MFVRIRSRGIHHHKFQHHLAWKKMFGTFSDIRIKESQIQENGLNHKLSKEIFPDSLGFFSMIRLPGYMGIRINSASSHLSKNIQVSGWQKETDSWKSSTSRIVCSWIFEAGCDADANGKVSVSECLGCLLEGSCLAWICLRFLGRRWFLSRCFVAIAYLSREH